MQAYWRIGQQDIMETNVKNCLSITPAVDATRILYNTPVRFKLHIMDKTNDAIDAFFGMMGGGVHYRDSVLIYPLRAERDIMDMQRDAKTPGTLMHRLRDRFVADPFDVSLDDDIESHIVHEAAHHLFENFFSVPPEEIGTDRYFITNEQFAYLTSIFAGPIPLFDLCGIYLGASRDQEPYITIAANFDETLGKYSSLLSERQVRDAAIGTLARIGYFGPSRPPSAYTQTATGSSW